MAVDLPSSTSRTPSIGAGDFGHAGHPGHVHASPRPRAAAVPVAAGWPAVAAMAGGFLLVPGETLGLSVGVVTFLLTRAALEALLDH